MKRSALKPSAFKRKPGASFSSFRSATKQLERKPMKKRARKAKPGDDRRMRDACRNEPCYLQIPGVCNGDRRTCVPAHRNEGKGAGLKNADFFTLPACFTCHTEFDQGKRFVRQQKRDMWNAAFERWSADRAAKLGITQPQMETA
jgi:hypothetical protein